VSLIQSNGRPCRAHLAGGLVSALLGLGIGYLTLRLRGVFFSIATLALSIVLQTMIINWDYVGGSRGLSVIRPSSRPSAATSLPLHRDVLLAVVAVTAARFIERSWIGAGWPRPGQRGGRRVHGRPHPPSQTLATTISGFLLGVAPPRARPSLTTSPSRAQFRFNPTTP